MKEGRSTFATFAIAAVLSLGASTAPAAEPTNKELLDKIQALESEVRQLKAQQQQQQQQQQNKQDADAKARSAAASTQADDVRSTTDAVRADAERHSTLMETDAGFTAGWDPAKGFVIRSEDGRFLMHPWAFVQARYAANYRPNAKNGTSDDLESGFEVPRMKLVLDGNLFSPDLTYQFIWATSDTTGNLGLQDAWARYHIPNTPLALRAGQIRNPLDHEQILYATRSLTPDRSIVNNVLLNGDDIVKGASIGYGYDVPSPLRSEVAFTSGQRNFDTSFQGFPTNPADWGAVGRVEWKLMGNWKDYTQFTALDDKEPLLVLGAGMDYTEAGDTGAFTHLVDAQFDLPQGLSLYGSYLGRYVRHNAGNPSSDGGATGNVPTANTYDSTVRLMAGYVIDQHWEPFVRYEYLHFDRAELPATAAHTVMHDLTAGFNYYIYGHRAKFSTGVTYLPNGSPVTNTLGDLLTSKRNEVIIQTQFQLMI